MQIPNIRVLMVLTMAIFIGCSENEEDEVSNGLKDSRDGQTYKVVIIGSQVWMAENLNFETGDGSWAYADKSSNSDIYGRLYDWETRVMFVRKDGICLHMKNGVG